MYIHGKTLTKSLLVSLVCLSNTFASSTFLPETSELLLAPKCFIDNNSFTYNELVFNAKDNTVLFSVDRESWWKQLESINHKGDCGKFINVNYEWDQYLNSSKINPARVSTLDYGYF